MSTATQIILCGAVLYFLLAFARFTMDVHDARRDARKAYRNRFK